jgi:hypothetical protein
MAFYEFKQNNTGGHFDFDKYVGYAVIVEADSPEQANYRATEELPLYFDGCSMGRDCSCCGDRWYQLYDSDEGAAVPSLYGEPLPHESKAPFNNDYWGGWIVCHSKDGRRTYYLPDGTAYTDFKEMLAEREKLSANRKVAA